MLSHLTVRVTAPDPSQRKALSPLTANVAPGLQLAQKGRWNKNNPKAVKPSPLANSSSVIVVKEDPPARVAKAEPTAQPAVKQGSPIGEALLIQKVHNQKTRKASPFPPLEQLKPEPALEGNDPDAQEELAESVVAAPAEAQAPFDDEPFPELEPPEWHGGRGYTEGPLGLCGPSAWGMHEYAPASWSSDEEEEEVEGAEDADERSQWIWGVLARLGVKAEAPSDRASASSAAPPTQVRLSINVLGAGSGVRLSIDFLNGSDGVGAEGKEVEEATRAAEAAEAAEAAGAEATSGSCVTPCGAPPLTPPVHPSWLRDAAMARSWDAVDGAWVGRTESPTEAELAYESAVEAEAEAQALAEEEVACAIETFESSQFSLMRARAACDEVLAELRDAEAKMLAEPGCRGAQAEVEVMCDELAAAAAEEDERTLKMEAAWKAVMRSAERAGMFDPCAAIGEGETAEEEEETDGEAGEESEFETDFEYETEEGMDDDEAYTDASQASDDDDDTRPRYGASPEVRGFEVITAEYYY